MPARRLWWVLAGSSDRRLRVSVGAQGVWAGRRRYVTAVRGQHVFVGLRVLIVQPELARGQLPGSMRVRVLVRQDR